MKELHAQYNEDVLTNDICVLSNKNQLSKVLLSTGQQLQPSNVSRERLPRGTFCASSIDGSAPPAVVQADMEGYIVGGDFAPIYNFPHSVYLSISCARQNSIDEFICAGSVLNQYFVLTAGHCLEDCGKNSKVVVSIGNEHIDRGVLSTAASCKIHERYDGFTMVNDIALVRLKTPIKFNKNVKRVAISRNPPYNEPAYVAGWGVVDDNKHIGTKRLKYVQQSLWSRDECAKMLRHVPVGTICGGLRNAQTNFAAS
ncbi:unnamed protein product [Diatraea saccharalis]|uniref:Peptidase S1 domain-containing protein n=1 Tax=Diatraea saccharalis TaxID=40085 RepID=A0A9N9W8H2_9NEOP|nr:unnamed protein product [Diatraea saccharalis]